MLADCCSECGRDVESGDGIESRMKSGFLFSALKISGEDTNVIGLICFT